MKSAGSSAANTMTQKRLAVAACIFVTALYFSPVIGLGFFKAGFWPIDPRLSIDTSLDVGGLWLPIGASGQLNDARFVGNSRRTVAYAHTSAFLPWRMQFVHVSALDDQELAAAAGNAVSVGSSPWGDILRVNRFIPATSQLYVIPSAKLMLAGEARMFIRDIHAVGGVEGSASLKDDPSLQ
jgi:hypothetical protein